MTRTLTILAVMATTLAPVATAANAQGVFLSPNVSTQRPQLTGLRAHVQSELPNFGYRNVDVRRLSNGQVAHINSLIHSGRSNGDIRGMIGATLRGGFLQRGVDRVLR